MGAYRNINGVLRPHKTMVGKARQTISKPPTRTYPKQDNPLNTLRRLSAGEAPNICIMRSLGGIGDVIMTTPILRALKLEWPNARITYATDFNYMDGALKDVLQHNPYIDEIIPYQVVKNKKFDFVHDVTSVCINAERLDPRNCLNRIDIFASSVGVSLNESDFLPIYVVTSDEEKWAKEKLALYPRSKPSVPRIGIQVRASTQVRSWGVENMRDLGIKLYNELGAQVLIFDSPHGQGTNLDWNIRGLIPIIGYSIRSVAALINECDLLITPDSGLMHLGGALNKRMVTLWAGTNYKARINHYPNAVAIARDNYKCYPCMYNPQPCARNYTCIKSITVDEAYNTVVEKLNTPIVKHDSQSVCTEIVKPNIRVSEMLDKSNKILFNRCSGLGDELMLTSVIQTVRKLFPNYKCSVRISHPELLQNVPEIEHVIYGSHETTPTMQERRDFGHIVDMNFLVESASVTDKTPGCTDAEYLSIFRPELFHKKLDLEYTTFPGYLYNMTDEEKLWANNIIGSMKHKKTICYVTNTQSILRSYPLDLAQEVINELHHKYNLIVLGTWQTVWGDKAYCNNFTTYLKQFDSKHLYIGSELSLRQAIALLGNSDIAIIPDTGLLHVAEAVGTQTVALFGNMDPVLRCRDYKCMHPLTSNYTCIHKCSDRPAIQQKTCPAKSFNQLAQCGAPCMHGITPQMICDAVAQIP